MSDTEPVAEAPAPEAPAPEAAEPVVAEPAPEAPAQEGVVGEPGEVSEPVEPPATTPSEPEEPADPFEAYGGKEAIEAAHRMYQAAQTDDGVVQLFIEAGRSLGLGLKELEGLFNDLAGSEPAEEVDPDEPLTRGQFEEMQRKAAEAAQQQAAQQAQETARKAVESTIKDLGLDPADPTTKTILQMADTHVGQDFSAENVAKAVRQGHADFQAQVEREYQKYLATKQQQAESVPSAPAGAGAPAEPAPAEPQNTAEAIQQVRKKLGLARR